MVLLKTDSPLSRRIVRSFFDFLDSVEPGPGVDVEGLEVAKECLSEVFKLDSFSVDDPIEPGFLVNLFRSLEKNENQNVLSHGGAASSVDVCASSSFARDAAAAANPSGSEAINTQGEDQTSEAHTIGASRDELFGQFFAALEKIHFFKTLPDGNEDPFQLDKATRIFHDALNEMEKNRCQSYDRNSLADTLKTQGNRAMQSKLYPDAIELYSCAIGLSENNAVYYCNRAAAYTQIHKYNEAIRDCLKSIEIDPNYSKAYSRLGLAYYAQGNYRDAIDKGFQKALQLDPNNESVRENIRVAEQKWKEEQQQTEWDQNTSSSARDNQEFSGQSAGRSWSHGVPPPFTSIPFNTNAIPGDIASMFMNMASNSVTGQHSQDRQGEGRSNATGSEEPGIRLGGNINLNLGESMPEELTGALRSMMEMFSGGGGAAPPQGDSQGTMNERSQSS